MPKVHKKYTVQVPMSPVNSQCGSLSAVVSKYIDYYLQKLVKFVPSYVNRSQQVVDACNKVAIINLNTRLLSSDDVNMYGNIDPVEGIDTIEKYFELFAKECKTHFP